jgi:hypothetical protein
MHTKSGVAVDPEMWLAERKPWNVIVIDHEMWYSEFLANCSASMRYYRMCTSNAARKWLLRVAGGRRSNSAHLTTLLHRTLPHVQFCGLEISWHFLTYGLVFTTTAWVRCTPPQPTRKNRGFRVYHGFLFALNETRYGKTTGCVVSSGSFRTPLVKYAFGATKVITAPSKVWKTAHEVEPSRM